MSIAPVGINNISFKRKQPRQVQKTENPTSIDGTNKGNRVALKHSPVTIGVVEGICGGAVSMALEVLYNKLFNIPFKTKPMLIFNAFFGAGIGIWAYSEAKKSQKNANA